MGGGGDRTRLKLIEETHIDNSIQFPRGRKTLIDRISEKKDTQCPKLAACVFRERASADSGLLLNSRVTEESGDAMISKSNGRD